jgi:hypothetical protein
MAKPAAIHITKKPCTRKDSVLKMNLVSGETPAAASWATAGSISSRLTVAAIAVGPAALALGNRAISLSCSWSDPVTNRSREPLPAP